MSWKNIREDTKKAGYEMGSGIFYKLEEGDNEVRILCEFKPFGSHFNKATNTSTFCVGKENGCPVCKEGIIPVKPRFLGYVIDRKDGKIKLAEFGYQIIKQISDLSNNIHWSFEEFPDYDMTIIKTEGAITSYNVQGIPDKHDITNTEKEELEKFITTHGTLEENISKKKQVQIEKNGTVINEELGGSPTDEDLEATDNIPF